MDRIFEKRRNGRRTGGAQVEDSFGFKNVMAASSDHAVGLGRGGSSANCSL